MPPPEVGVEIPKSMSVMESKSAGAAALPRPAATGVAAKGVATSGASPRSPDDEKALGERKSARSD